MAVTMGNEGRALLADTEARYRAAQAFEEIPNIGGGEPADEAPAPMSRPAAIALLALAALAFVAVAVIGLARLAQWMGKA